MRGLMLFPLAISAIACPVASQAESSTSTNLGLASVDALVDGRTAVFVVTESGQASTDLNGDGDAFDRVLHVHDATSGETVNLGLAVGPGRAVFVHGLVAFEVDEFQLGADLNGDGDVLDPVLHTYEVATGELTNLGLATPYEARSDGRRIVLVVDEHLQGDTDLNGDGDALDLVAHAYDVDTGITTNLGLALAGPPKLADELVALPVLEADQGGTDLNGDGDAFDSVLHLHDFDTGITTNLGLDTTTYYVERDHVALLVREFMQGFTDLNGDGDVDDEVLHVHDAITGVTTNVGLATSNLVGAAGAIAYLGSEPGQQQDLNGDGDTIDDVLHTLNLASGRQANLGLASLNGYVFLEGRRLVWLASESGQGLDLDGDGDHVDEVLFTRDLVTGETKSSGLASYTVPALAGNYVAFEVSEFDQGGQDLNGDGDAADIVVHVRDLLTGTTTNLGLAASALWGEGNMIAIGVSESDQGGTDLNGDGDALDLVLHVWDPADGTVENLGVAAGIPFQAVAGDVDVAVSLASETLIGSDLNGDGDTFDRVPFLFRFDVPFGFVGDADRVRLSAGDPQELALDAGPDAAGDVYVLVGSFSGTSPGIALGPVVLPLNWDAYMGFLFQNPNSPILSGSLGVLDAQGEAMARFQLPAGSDPTLAGVTLNHAYLVIDVGTWTFGFASNAFGVMLAP